MAAQDNSGSTPTPTSVIASEFIRAYYNALSNEPSALYAFYEDDSKFSRFEEGQITDATPAQGQLAIHEAVQSIPYAGCKVRIETTDSHDSAFGCVIVIVTGIIVLVGQPPRTFVQTFLLQPLVSGSPHFYVRNDILRYTSKITPPPATTTPAPASSNHLPVPDQQQHAPRPASPVATPASAPSSPKKQPIVAPASPQPVAPKSPVKKAEEPVAAPEPVVAPKSPQRSPEPAPAAASASPTPEEQPAAAPAEKPQRVRKDRPKREKPAAAAPATAAAPAAEAPAPAAAAPAEAKQEQKAPAKVAEKPKAVAKPPPVQPPRPTTWASRLFNAAKDGPLGLAKLATGTDVEPLETAPIEPALINGDAAAPATTTTTNTETDQAARKPRSNKRPPSRTGKSGDAPTAPRERDPLYSLWVNNIPPQTTQPELNTLFGQYGNMRPIRLVAGKTYCFVDYYDVPSLENALRARPIKIHGVELSVDKKQMKQTPRPTSATSTTSKPAPAPAATPATTEDDDGFQKSTAGRSRAYKQRVASENKAAAAQQAQAQQATSGTRPASGAKKPAPTNGAPRK